MKKITHTRAIFYVMYGMVKDLFYSSCAWGTIIYYIITLFGYDIEYTRCFLSIVLIRSIYMGIMCYIRKDEISEAIERAVESFNEEV